jgi:hypothetical protein
MRPNYLETTNPFGLAAPPDWFLRDLFAQDPALVIFPSMVQPFYRVARRCTHTPGLVALQTVLSDKAADVKLLIAEKLVPVTDIYPRPHWGPLILEELHKRDIWAAGGADKAADRLEADEAERDARIDRQGDDELDRRGTSAYFGLQQRQGDRVFLRS